MSIKRPGQTLTDAIVGNEEKLNHFDPTWNRIHSEANDIIAHETDIAGIIHRYIFECKTLEEALAVRICDRLANTDLPKDRLYSLFADYFSEDDFHAVMLRADLAAVLDRDAATNRLIDPLLYYKGFHALQVHRIAHYLYNNGRVHLALMLQSMSSAGFQCDIHPAARFGKGIFIDHATGFVVGETASVGDDCSFLHGVTLGGTGKEDGDRHPKLSHNVLVGAGAKILGNIKIDYCVRIAAGSVVLKDVPANVTMAGVPAKIVGDSGCPDPARTMDQLISE